MNNNFYKINEVTQHKYYQIPKELYTNPKYKTVINNDAKILYALLLDRMELSRMNEWVDEDGTIFLMFKREDLADMLGLCVTTVWRAFKQLKEVGLIAEKRQGLNRPNIIYIGKIQYENDTSSEQGDIFVPSESENINVQTDKTSKSGDLKSKSQDLENLKPNKTKKNITDDIKTEINNTESKKTNAEEKNINLLDSS
ncbi:MAG: helix-turn-helix domain-containing protein [Bacteroidales bacterium]|jgi:hypothetical protein|nr:helix-turn-helix domain-containing protein [Bacteroidales bacterium]